MTNTLAPALEYLERFPDHYLFPIAHGKKSPPCFEGYATKGSYDPRVLKLWHGLRPGCSWGLAPGKSNIVVIDADLKPGKNGQRSLDALELMYGPLPDTSVMRTPSGGRHFRFKATNRVRHIFRINGFGEHLDSPHYTVIISTGGKYELENDLPLALAPDWFADLLGEAREHKANANRQAIGEVDSDDAIATAIETLQYYVASPRQVSGRTRKQTNGPAIEGEGGDEWTYQVACNVGDLGVSEDVCLDLMFEHFNPFCLPQWLADNEEGDSKDRLSTKVRSAYSSRETPIGSKTAIADFMDDPPPPLTKAMKQAAAREHQRRLRREADYTVPRLLAPKKGTV